MPAKAVRACALEDSGRAGKPLCHLVVGQMQIRKFAPLSIFAGCAWMLIAPAWLAAPPMVNTAAAQQQGFAAGIKQSVQKLTGTGSAPSAAKEPVPSDDPISLQTPAKPSPKLYLAVARLYEQAGRLQEAEKNYLAALQQKPDDLVVMLEYARLLERMNRPQEAISVYQRAAKAHPREAAVPNNLGLCYARQGMLDEAVASLNRAIALQPKNMLYRNNMATVLVEMGRMQEAYSHLRAVHSEAASYYNLGYLLNKKGRKQDAINHFAAALRADPSLAPARQWLLKLQSELAGVPAHPQSAATVQPDAVPPPVHAASTARGTPEAPSGEQLRVGSRPVIVTPQPEPASKPATAPPPAVSLDRRPPNAERPAVPPPNSGAQAPPATSGRTAPPAETPLPPLPPEPPGVIRLPPISANSPPATQSR